MKVGTKFHFFPLLMMWTLASCDTETTTVSMSDISTEELLEELKDAVSNLELQSYMRDERYLMSYLKSSHFNVTEAKAKMESVLKWRKEENIDNLPNEEYLHFDADYALFLEGCDKLERPVITVPLGSWDLRAAILEGKGSKLQRYMDKILEESSRFLQVVNLIGAVDVYEAAVIVDMDGFDMRTHACPKCIPVYLYFFNAIQHHYPGLIDKIYFVNTPQIVTLMFPIYNETFIPSLMKKIVILNTDKEAWRSELLRDINGSQLSRNLGGENSKALEFVFVRQMHDMISSLNEVDAINVKPHCSENLAMFRVMINEIRRISRKQQGRELVEQERKRSGRCL